MEDPFYYTYPPEWTNTIGPRNLIHCWATDTVDSTVQPRWGEIGKQKIVDEGPLPPEPRPGIKYNMGTFYEVITQSTIGFIDKATKDGKPFFVWMNPTRAHVLTHLSPKYDALRNPQTDFGLEEAALKQMDDNIGVVLAHLKDSGLDDNTIVVFTTDNGAEVYTWPDGGTTPFAGAKGEVTEGAFRDWGYDLARKEFREHIVTEGESWALGNKDSNPGLSIEANAALVEPGLEMANEALKKKVYEEVKTTIDSIYATHGKGKWKEKILVDDRIADSMLQQVLTRPEEFEVAATVPFIVTSDVEQAIDALRPFYAPRTRALPKPLAAVLVADPEILIPAEPTRGVHPTPNAHVAEPLTRGAPRRTGRLPSSARGARRTASPPRPRRRRCYSRSEIRPQPRWTARTNAEERSLCRCRADGWRWTPRRRPSARGGCRLPVAAARKNSAGPACAARPTTASRRPRCRRRR